INTYIGLLDFIIYDIKFNFFFKKFKQNAYIITINIKQVLVKAYNSISKIKKVYT
ncbi:hypothetical protein DL98DRAFT_442653, partial [Cadophora sp. DSE1049]